MQKTKSEALAEFFTEVDEDKRWAYLKTDNIICVPGDLPREGVRVMVVGQNPGAQENAAGKPFVGTIGRVLNGLLDLAGIGRRNAYVTTVIPYKTPGNRQLTTGEVIHGMDLLREQWKIIQPTLTIGIGSQAHLALFERLPASHMPRGEVWDYGSTEQGSYYCLQYHPSYGLRNPKNRPKMERDWELLWQQCKELGGILCDQCNGNAIREDLECICTGSGG